MAKGIFIAENMASTKLPTLLKNAKQATAIENGAVVKLTGLVSGERNLHTSDAVATNKDEIFLVDGVELISAEDFIYGLDDFENVANKPFRARKPMVGDVFSISEAQITALATTVVVGNVVETPATGNKLIEKTSATSGVSFVAKIVARYNFGKRAIPMVRLEVTQVV